LQALNPKHSSFKRQMTSVKREGTEEERLKFTNRLFLQSSVF